MARFTGGASLATAPASDLEPLLDKEGNPSATVQIDLADDVDTGKPGAADGNAPAPVESAYL